jgi:four helix bundle protein
MEDDMLRIYPVILEMLRMLRPVIKAVERHDRALAGQLRKASASIALNTREGSGSRGGTRRMRYETASGSTQETGGCLDTALALGYVEVLDADLLDKLDHVGAVLWRLSH